MDNLEAQFEEALAKHRTGDIASADIVYSKILSVEPDHTEARHMKAIVHLQNGLLQEAEEDVRRALKKDNGKAKYFNTLGSILVQQGRLSEALTAFESAFVRDGQFTAAAYNIGTVLLSLGRSRNAEIVFRKMLDNGASDVAIYNNLASALIKQNRISEAVECCRGGLTIHKDHPELGTTLASAFELSNNLVAAREEASKIHDTHPDFVLTRLILARVMRRQGALDEAFETLEPIFQATLAVSDEAEANYEMGLIQDVRKNYPEAFHHFSKCNSILLQSPESFQCDGDRYVGKVREYSRWRNDVGPKQTEQNIAAPKLVFFVGFPRSGTTLMEQVLKSHPNVITTEENSPLPIVETEARRLAENQGLAYPDCLNEWGADTIDDLRRLFLDKAEELVGSFAGKVLVDKLPLNIVSLGLVEHLWPEARVLVALRDPRDVCLSCFIQRFTLNEAMVNFLDLDRTGALYASVMKLWLKNRKSLSLPFLEYKYEGLVDDFESTTRQILEFIGVDWHADVSNYREEAKQRDIRTPSYREVTAPIHKKAVKRWRNYQEELAPIMPHLEPLLQAFEYED